MPGRAAHPASSAAFGEVGGRRGGELSGRGQLTWVSDRSPSLATGGALFGTDLLIWSHALVPDEAKTLYGAARFGTRLGTGGARLAATGGAHCDEAITLSSECEWLWLYFGGTGATHWDGGTLLPIRRLGVRIPPSALRLTRTFPDHAFTGDQARQ
jgi:hypothetical protein